MAWTSNVGYLVSASGRLSYGNRTAIDLNNVPSPVGAVGLALRAVNEVKLDRARLLLVWVTRLTFNWTLLWADQLRP